jgi:hypothetical protein
VSHACESLLMSSTDLGRLLTRDAPIACCSPTKELSVQTARVLKLLLPGMRVRCSVLSKSTAAGTDFSKASSSIAQQHQLLVLSAGVSYAGTSRSPPH